MLTRDCLITGIARSFRLDPSGVGVIASGEPAPDLRPGEVMVASCVDNVKILGPGEETTRRALDGFLAELSWRVLLSHEVTGPTCTITI